MCAYSTGQYPVVLQYCTVLINSIPSSFRNPTAVQKKDAAPQPAAFRGRVQPAAAGARPGGWPRAPARDSRGCSAPTPAEAGPEDALATPWQEAVADGELCRRQGRQGCWCRWYCIHCREYWEYCFACGRRGRRPPARDPRRPRSPQRAAYHSIIIIRISVRKRQELRFRERWWRSPRSCAGPQTAP